MDNPVDDAVLDHVQKWLTQDEKEQIDVIPRPREKTRKFLDIMIRKSEEGSFNAFIEGLKANKNTDIAKRLEEKLEQIYKGL